MREPNPHSGPGKRLTAAGLAALTLTVLVPAALSAGVGEPTLPAAVPTEKLVVQDGIKFGASLAAEGDLLAVGTSVIADNDLDQDWVFIFERQDGNWVQTAWLDPGDDPLPDDETPDQADKNEAFGYAVAVDSEKERVVVGDPGYDVEGETQAGAVYVYDRLSNGTWEQSALLCCPIVNGDDNELPGIHRDQPGFGRAVAVEGNTLVVGAPDAHRSHGRVWIFEQADNGTWEREAVLASDRPQPMWGSLFGNSVAVSGDTLAVGAPSSLVEGTEYGAVYIYRESETTWEQVERLVAPEDHRGEEWGLFGLAVDLEGDTLLTADPGPEHSQIQQFHPSTYGNGNKGYVFDRSPGAWHLSAVLDPKGPVPEFDPFFGRDLDLSEDGRLAVIGADQGDPYDLHAGEAYTFSQHSGKWEEERKLVSNETSPYEQFGKSTAIAADLVWVGAPYDDDRRGNGLEAVAELGWAPFVGTDGDLAGSVFGFERGPGLTGAGGSS